MRKYFSVMELTKKVIDNDDEPAFLKIQQWIRGQTKDRTKVACMIALKQIFLQKNLNREHYLALLINLAL